MLRVTFYLKSGQCFTVDMKGLRQTITPGGTLAGLEWTHADEGPYLSNVNVEDVSAIVAEEVADGAE